MSRYSYSSDEDSRIDVRVSRHRAPSPTRRPVVSPPGPHYIQTVGVRRERPSSYYQTGPVMLDPARTVVRTRSRSHERVSSPPSQAPVAPVVIHNKIYNEQSDDSDSDDSHHRRRRSTRSRSRSRHSRNSSVDSADARERWELEQARRQLEELKLAQRSEREDGRIHKQYREEAELQRAKAELDEIKRREARERDEKRIRKEMELRRLEEERREEEERERREKEKKLAIAEYKAKEAERIVKEREEKERAEKEYQRRLQEDLIRAGVDEKDIEAIIKKEKIKRADDERRREDDKNNHGGQLGRPIYTRMSLKHLDIETLYYFKIDWEYDPVSFLAPQTRGHGGRRVANKPRQEPGYILIKRPVPEWEQDQLWTHTRQIRLVREREHSDHKVVLKIEDKKHKKHKDDDQFMWVAKKTDRRRSKSPGLLMYLAGGRPA